MDRDLRDRLRRAGYSTNPLISSMCDLFEQIASEADERSANAQRQLADEIVGR
ncbi:MAG TPA: hypothetical protein VJP76_06880 [Candidatus Tumulicola sp.]|nr:hypothetical protein [Candidatus Tumulicola sp.]